MCMCVCVYVCVCGGVGVGVCVCVCVCERAHACVKHLFVSDHSEWEIYPTNYVPVQNSLQVSFKNII